MRLPSHLRLLLPFALSGAVIFCNAAPEAGATLISEPASFINSESADGWYLIAPYGDARQMIGDKSVTQRFGFVNAKAIVSDFKGIVARVLERRFGTANLPVLYGHPDDVGWSLINSGKIDHTTYSRVEDMEARPDGLWAKFAGWEPGFDKLPKGLGISPRWIGFANSADASVWEPAKLLSLGLCEATNLKGTSLVNADMTTPDPAVPEVTATPSPDLAAQVTALSSTIATLTTERDSLKQQLDTANRDWSRKYDEASAYRAALATALARDYVGFRNAITPAEEPALVASLVNAATPAALDAILTPLQAKPVSLPATHAAASLVNARAANPDAASALTEFRGKVAELQATGLPYGDAWKRAETSHAALFKSAFPNG